MYTYKDYLKEEKLPHIWCAGCSNGIILNALVHALADMQIPPEEVVIITGSGCLARLVTYPDTSTMKKLHGRVLPGATGVKLANPKLKVFCIMGDGDGATIGGNHLIHAARRNIDVTAIICNNFNYGMTGGQYSATTPLGANTVTSRYGLEEENFDLAELVKACGAPYVARVSASDVMSLRRYIVEATQKKGFGFIEVLGACVTHYGKNNKMGDAPRMMRAIDAMTVPVARAAKMTEEELAGKFIVGKIVDRNDKLDCGTRYEIIREEAKAK